MNRQVVGLGNQLGLLALATCIAWTGCSSKVTYVGIDIQMLVAINVDRSRIATLEFYLDELDGSPAIFDVVTTAWQDGVQNGVPYKMRHDDIDSDQKYELVFRIDQNLFNATNSFSFSISGERRALLFKIKARVRDANDAILGTGESSALNFDGTLQSARVNICANAQCPTGVSVGSDGGADILHSVQLTLDPGVVAANVASLDFYFDEAPGNGTLYAAAVTTPSYGLLDDYLYSYTIEDVDADSKYELQVKIAANVFATTSVFSFGLSGTAATAPFQIVARVRNASGSVLGSGTSATITLGTSVQPATVTICATPSGCSGGTGDAGIGDAGAGADAGAGEDGGSGGGADAGASADAGGATNDGGGGDDAGGAGNDAGADAGGSADAGVAGPPWCWGAVTSIENTTNQTGYPQVTVDSAGNANVVFRRQATAVKVISSNRYSGGWYPYYETVAQDDYNMNPPQLAGDSAGDSVAVWSDTQNRMWSSRFSGTSWGTATIFADAGLTVASVTSARDLLNGKTAAVWLATEGAYNTVWASLYATNAWQVPSRIQTSVSQSADDLRVAVGTATGATTIAAWRQPTTGAGDLWAAVNTGSGWSAQNVESGTGAASSPAITVESADVGHLAWSQVLNGGGAARIHYARYRNGAWDAPIIVDTTAVGPDTAPAIGVGQSSVVTVVFVRGETGQASPWAARGLDGGFIAGPISKSAPTSVALPRVAVNPSGVALAVWSQANDLWSNKASASGQWGDAGVLDTIGAAVTDHQVAIGAGGLGAAAWTKADSVYAAVCQ